MQRSGEDNRTNKKSLLTSGGWKNSEDPEGMMSKNLHTWERKQFFTVPEIYHSGASSEPEFNLS